MDPLLSEFLLFGRYALVAGVTVWLTLKLMDSYSSLKRNIAYQQTLADREKAVLQLKLQACERLILFLDRVSIPNLIGRVKTGSSQTPDLSTFMMLAIQKELEHNITQQLYVSGKLWEIISLIKDELSSAIGLLGQGEDGGILAVEEYIDRLFHYHQTQGVDLIARGQMAIREEVSKVI